MSSEIGEYSRHPSISGNNESVTQVHVSVQNYRRMST
jgi:hypothetical protein